MAQRRKRAGKDITASAAIMDWQSVKITEECGKPDPNAYDAHGNGYDAHKNVKSRKRHLLVDTPGLPLSIYVAPVDVEDREGVRLLLAGSKPLVPRLRKIRAAAAPALEEGIEFVKLGREPVHESIRGASGDGEPLMKAAKHRLRVSPRMAYPR